MSATESDRAKLELEEKIAAYLSQGGEIHEIPTGQLAEKTEKKSQWARSEVKKAAP